MTSWFYSLFDDWDVVAQTRKDPLVDTWLFMGSPVPVLSIIVFYLYFVLKLGPELMKNRAPLEIKPLILIYNGYQVIFNVLLIVVFCNRQNINLMYRVCVNADFTKEDASNLSTVSWWYFFSKIVDLVDTVFFVLRKKQSQVTFLHVYHHFLMVVLTWAFLKYVPSEQAIFLGTINTVVHGIMYLYYFLAALGPQYKKYLWWKKYMTRIQLIQFFTGVSYLFYSITMVDCQVPKAIPYFFCILGIIFIYLFSDFYKNTYGSAKESKNKKFVTICYSDQTEKEN